MARRSAISAASSTGAVYAALAGNVLVALTKAAAALITGSAAMTSEAIHSAVDTANELLLLYGLRRSELPPDKDHPLGYGRELYFWSFIVALLVFAGGALAALWQGAAHLIAPEPVRDPLVNYVVLGLSALFEGGSWWISWRQFARAKGRLGVYEAFRRSKDPPSFMVLFEDSAALLGLAVAALGNLGAQILHEPRLDGASSLVIGLILAATAALLARESKSLLIGESASPVLATSILSIAASKEGVAGVAGLFTVQLAPNQVVAALSLAFEDRLRAPQIEDIVDQIEADVGRNYPQIVQLFIKPQRPAAAERLARIRRVVKRKARRKAGEAKPTRSRAS
jgi:cation diffusion facilitator family transporter